MTRLTETSDTSICLRTSRPRIGERWRHISHGIRIGLGRYALFHPSIPRVRPRRSRDATRSIETFRDISPEIPATDGNGARFRSIIEYLPRSRRVSPPGFPGNDRPFSEGYAAQILPPAASRLSFAPDREPHRRIPERAPWPSPPAAHDPDRRPRHARGGGRVGRARRRRRSRPSVRPSSPSPRGREPAAPAARHPPRTQDGFGPPPACPQLPCRGMGRPALALLLLAALPLLALAAHSGPDGEHKAWNHADEAPGYLTGERGVGHARGADPELAPPACCT